MKTLKKILVVVGVLVVSNLAISAGLVLLGAPAGIPTIVAFLASMSLAAAVAQ